MLQDASNAISSINCSIKSTIIENLRVIKKVNGELLELKRQIKFSSTYGSGSSNYRYSGSSNYGGSSNYSGSSSDNEIPEGCWPFIIIGAIILLINMCS